MKKTIKIIDLLNKIANGEYVPKKIKYDVIEETEGYAYTYSKEEKDYIYWDDVCEKEYFFEQIFNSTKMDLNDEVEILDEEEFEDIKPLVLRTFERTGQAVTTDRLEDYCDYNFEMIENTIAKMVLNQKKIIERLNKDK